MCEVNIIHTSANDEESNNWIYEQLPRLPNSILGVCSIDLVIWLAENTRGTMEWAESQECVHIIENCYVRGIDFDDDADAMAFKLRWL